MAKQNCWDFKNCGRQVNGPKAVELGVCSAAKETRTNGVNGGVNGGRGCWAIAGTLCGGVVQGSFVSKVANCMKCEFYQLVGKQEGVNHQSAKDILALMN